MPLPMDIVYLSIMVLQLISRDLLVIPEEMGKTEKMVIQDRQVTQDLQDLLEALDHRVFKDPLEILVPMDHLYVVL